VERRIGSLLAEHHIVPDKENLSAPSHEDKEMEESTRSLKGLGSDWRSAIDPNTGRTYYWNRKSRERRWELDAAL